MSEIIRVLKEVSIIGLFFFCVCCALLHGVKSGKLYHSQDSETGQHNAATSVVAAQGAVDQQTRTTRMISNTNFMPERKHLPHVQEREDELLTAPYTTANYKDKFRLLINHEEKEHVKALKQ